MGILQMRVLTCPNCDALFNIFVGPPHTRKKKPTIEQLKIACPACKREFDYPVEVGTKLYPIESELAEK